MLTYSDYKRFYERDLSQIVFDRYAFIAENYICNITKCVDGFEKLIEAFPTKERDVEAIKRCLSAIVDIYASIDDYNEQATSGELVASRSAGNESISYVRGVGMVAEAVKSQDAKNRLLYETAKTYLSGAKDANNVNLLYTGNYPM